MSFLPNFFLVCLLGTLITAAPVVLTPYGAVSGIMDQGVYAFKGIPYAAPPVRFADPEEAIPWTGIRDGSKFGAGCIARCATFSFPRPDLMCTPTTSEDCLFINVFTPTLNASANLPVIMFIHGGNYIGGSGGVPIYDGGDLARNQNVVVVTINYRLGIFGALYTGTVKGNFHTKDQRASMKWVNKAISAFGGNPNLVTITGQSAGAVSVAIHLSSPLSWPYFQRAIIVSNPFSVLPPTAEMALQLGEKVLEGLNCPSGGTTELECLRNASAHDISVLQNNTDYSPWAHELLAMMMQWMPVVDGSDLPMQPLRALTTGQHAKVPVFFGTVANESVMFINDISHKPIDTLGYYIMLEEIFGSDITKGINKEYGPLPEKYHKDSRPFLSVLATDYMFYCVSRWVGKHLTKTTPTFMWYYDHIASYNKWVYQRYMPFCVNEVCHADDLAMIFNPFKVKLNFTVPQPTKQETELSHFIQTAWGNFARTGDPNPLPDHITFPHFNGTKNILVNYSTPVSSMLDGYRDGQCNFWDTVGYFRY